MQDDLAAAHDARGIFFISRGDIEPVSSGRRPCPDLIGPGATAGDDNAVGRPAPSLASVKRARKDFVPERAMVPRLSISSCRSIPMPLSITASVPVFLSGTMRIFGGSPSAARSGAAIAS
jgi:hypothetical protein